MPYNPTKPIEAEILPEESTVIPQGHTGTVTVRVTSQSIEPLEVSVSLEKELPQGVEVKFRPEAFSLNPSETVDVELTLTVSPMAPPPQWPRRPPPKVGESLVSAITEQPYYSIVLLNRCMLQLELPRLRLCREGRKETNMWQHEAEI